SLSVSRSSLMPQITCTRRWCAHARQKPGVARLKCTARKAKKSELAYLWGVQASHFLAFGLPSLSLSSDTQRRMPSYRGRYHIRLIEGVSEVWILCEMNRLISWRFNKRSTLVTHLPLEYPLKAGHLVVSTT